MKRSLKNSARPRLVFDGMGGPVCGAVRPFCVREYVPGSPAGQAPRWNNLLIRGDNRLALSSLSNGPLRRFIEERGGLKLIYIDPPFTVGADFPMEATVGNATGRRIPNLPAGPAFKDTWEGGMSAFLAMMEERLTLMRGLLAPDGSLYLHCDRRTSAYLRLVMDAVFGANRHLGEIIWHYTGGGRSKRYFSRKHDTILHYARSGTWTFNLDAVRVPYRESSGYAKSGITSRAGKRYAPNPLGTPVDDVWDIPIVNPLSRERLAYPTQKPEALLERIILASSNEGDLVADFFCGSGTTLAVADRLNRHWLGCDLSRFAVQTAKKRLVRHSLAAASQSRAPLPFAVLEQSEPGGSEEVSGLPGKADSGIGEVRLLIRREEGGFAVELTGYAPPYHAMARRREHPSRGGGWVAVEGGAIVHITLGKDGEERREVLTASWREWIDCWSVDSRHGGRGDPFPPGWRGKNAIAKEPVFFCDWQGIRREPGNALPFRTPVFPMHDGSGTVAVRVTDIFGAEALGILDVPAPGATAVFAFSVRPLRP